MGTRRSSSSSSLDEDIDRFYTPHSRFSSDHIGGGEDSLLQHDAEPSRLLSEVENQMLNARIDHLVDVLNSGRTIVFDQDPKTGRVDISAEYSRTPSQKKESDLEADVAAFPENFGNVISSRRRMFRSPTSIRDSWATTESCSNDQDERLRDQLAIVDLSSDCPHGSPLQKDVDIRQAIRQLEREAGDPRGSRLARISSTEIEIDRVSPFPLDFDKARPARTPSVQSGKSQLDRSSPLFMESYRRRHQDTNELILESSSHDSGGRAITPDRVFRWLGQIEGSPQASAQEEVEGNVKEFEVLRDVSGIQDSGTHHGRDGPTTLTSKILKDVSNLRRPGYLQHNSFAAGEKQEPGGKPPKSLEIPTSGEESSHTYVGKKRLGFIDIQGGRGGAGPSGAIQNTDSPQKTLPLDQNSQFGKTVGSLQEPIDPERAAHFELALARLEGRIPPPPSSPIRRLVNPHSTYGSDVEVELRRLRPREPIAIRYQTGSYTVAQQFENMMRLERRREHSA